VQRASEIGFTIDGIYPKNYQSCTIRACSEWKSDGIEVGKYNNSNSRNDINTHATPTMFAYLFCGFAIVCVRIGTAGARRGVYKCR